MQDLQSSSSRNPAEAGQGLRKMMLTSSPEKLGIKPSEVLQKTYGVLMDWPIGQGNIATIVSLCDGNASLYTNGTFGVIGGIGNETVRNCAIEFVGMAEKNYAEALSTSDYTYPKPDRIKFYFLGYAELRVIEADLNLVSGGNHQLSKMFHHAQKMIGLFRQLYSARQK